MTIGGYDFAVGVFDDSKEVFHTDFMEFESAVLFARIMRDFKYDVKIIGVCVVEGW